jgi:hypothetical protein
MRAWSPYYSEFCCSQTQIRLIAFINRVDRNELVAREARLPDAEKDLSHNLSH